MAGPTRISQLTDGSPVQPTDQVPVARGSGATGYTYKVNAGRIVSDLFNVANSSTVDLTFDTSTRTLCAAANIPEATVNVVDSPTIDLTWNASTRTLSADVSTAVKNASAFNVVDSPTIDLDWNASTRTLSAAVSSINSFFTGTNQSLSASGYQKLPGGLIIQWGVYQNGPAASTTVTISFPMAFTANYVAIPISNSSADLNLTVLNYTTTTFQIRNASAINSANAFWIAIGY